METTESSVRRRPRRKWSDAEKKKIVEQASRMRTDGLGWTPIAKKLWIREQSLQRWGAKFDEMSLKRAKIKPIEIVSVDSSRGIARATSDGYRLDGLDLDSAIV